MTTLTFTNPILWVTRWSIGGADNTGAYASQNDPKCQEAMNLRGQIVQIVLGDTGAIYPTGFSPAYTEEKHVFKFWWEPHTVLDQMLYIAANNLLFSISGLSMSYGMVNQFRFQKEDPISQTPTFGEQFFNHEDAFNTQADLYDGEIHVLAIRSHAV